MKGKDMSKTMEAYLSMVSEAKAKLDPVDDKANDKKFKDRKDKDIDNDGDVDSSDKFLHKKRKPQSTTRLTVERNLPTMLNLRRVLILSRRKKLRLTKHVK